MHVLPKQHLGFSITVSNDTAFLTDSSVNIDSVYYALHGVSYPKGTPYMIVSEDAVNLICQYDFSTNGLCGLPPFCYEVNLTGIANTSFSTQVTLIPNPTTGIVHIQLPKANDITCLQVYNILGMLVATQQMQAGSTSADIDLGNEAAGTYLLKMSQGNDRCVKKVVNY